ncbi:hypothetical protein QJS10_CPB22g01357 [Acorus calamus]|uniref:ceramide glucosyltransferase n=1 Tax=Acorus calamus TaxID=4465 RepID=A0AAV9BZS4_ACOCL|nr:hypothetical protein QJS10_CPB22g01357 [Acorus calamus]
MEVIGALDAYIAAASRAFCSPLAVFIQLQGCCICLLLAIGWGFAAHVRNREIRRMRRSFEGGNSFAFLCQDIDELEHSAQITSLYGGPLEFLFVVESVDDPAYHVVSTLISEFQDSVDAKIVEAGFSTTCSQKIHNQLAGVEKMHKESKYVLFLDDDVRLHPGSIGALTAEMEKNPKIFIQTGYPLDLPSGSLGSYCIYEYHMLIEDEEGLATLKSTPCSMGFATGGKTFFLWGGCMMMHADDFRLDRHGVVTGLRDGGYSDDMTLAAIAGYERGEIVLQWWMTSMKKMRKKMCGPPSETNSFKYWNYLRKQTFVLESYISEVNWMMNRALFSSHIYLSWGFVAPYFMAMIHLAAALRVQFSDYPIKETTHTSVGEHTLPLRQGSCMLSPEGPPVSLKSYNWGLSINWSGVRYHLKNGKIHKIERCGEPTYSYLGGKHLFGRRGCPQKSAFLGSLSRSMLQWRQPKKFDA